MRDEFTAAAGDAALISTATHIAGNAVSVEAAAPWKIYSDRRRWGLLAVLFLVSTSNYLDRNVISVLLEPIKQEFHVSDTMLGLLGGFCFSVFYAVFGLPVARWADRGNRRTIITLALGVWSLMTLCCGLAQTFVQLAIARIGVGAGEAGAIPPAQSLIADYFSPQQRATAIAIFTAAAMAGYLLGFGFGGYIAATHGWRAAFLVAGAPGLILAVITRVTLSEPRLREDFKVVRNAGESIGETLAALLSKRSFLYAWAGCVLYFLVAYGALIFVPSFLIRTLHVSLAQVSVDVGAVSAIGSVVGTLSGGWIADRLARRDVRWLAWLPAVALVVTCPIQIVAFSVSSFALYLTISFFGGVLLMAGLPPVFAAIHAVCGSRRRATAIAIVLFSATLIGGGFGPLISGAISDGLTARYGADGLRYALISMMPLLAASGACFYMFAQAMPRDIED